MATSQLEKWTYMMFTYALHLLEKKKKKDMKSLSLFVPMNAKTCDDPDSPDVFLHALYSAGDDSAGRNTMRGHVDLKRVLGSETVLLHFYQLLWMDPAYLAKVLEAVNLSEEVRLYSSVPLSV